MLKKLLVTFLLFASPALAQSIQQSGSVTPGHVPYWITSGVQGDGGSSADSPITSFGVTNTGSAGICDNNARQASGAWQSLCLGYVGGVPTISVQNFGSASAQPLQFIVNGTTYPFPGSLSNITIGTTPVIGGTTSLCLYVSGGVVGQQTCTLSAITSLIGDVTATGPGISIATLAASGVTAGTYGSTTVVPVITVDAKGRITAVTSATPGITVGTTVVTSGTTNGLFYDNGSVLGNLATLGSGVLVTSAGGVPSISTTLPASLSIGSPTFTGTATFPDAATWSSLGISKVAALSVGSATIPSSGNVSISGQYQVSGIQIAASNLSNGTTGTGSVVLAASPTLSGTIGGSLTFSGAITLSSGFGATAAGTFFGSGAPALGAGQTVVTGTISVPTLANTGQGIVFNTTAGGLFLQGDGSTSDITMANKGGTTIFTVPTGTTKLNFPGLAVGTCASGLAIDASNNLIEDSCPGAASSIQVGTTSVTSGTNNNVLTSGTGTLANVTIASLLTAGNGITITGTTNATISQSFNSAVFQSTSALTGGGSLTGTKMEGFGGTCRLTPLYSTRVEATFVMALNNSGVLGSMSGQISAGTPASGSPSNGAAVTGTQYGFPVVISNQSVANDALPYTVTAIVTGLTAGTSYWFDIAMAAGANNVVVPSVSCTLREVL